jgi:hypothetical protein
VFCGLLLILNSIYASFFLIKVKDKKNNKTCVIATTAPPHNWPTERSYKKIQQSKKTTTTDLLSNSKYIPLQLEAYSQINRKKPRTCTTALEKKITQHTCFLFEI